MGPVGWNERNIVISSVDLYEETRHRGSAPSTTEVLTAQLVVNTRKKVHDKRNTQLRDIFFHDSDSN